MKEGLRKFPIKIKENVIGNAVNPTMKDIVLFDIKASGFAAASVVSLFYEVGVPVFLLSSASVIEAFLGREARKNYIKKRKRE